jgi:hypothetical protein
MTRLRNSRTLALFLLSAFIGVLLTGSGRQVWCVDARGHASLEASLDGRLCADRDSAHRTGVHHGEVTHPDCVDLAVASVIARHDDDDHQLATPRQVPVGDLAFLVTAPHGRVPFGESPRPSRPPTISILRL